MKIKVYGMPFGLTELFMISLLSCIGITGIMGVLIYGVFWLLLGEQPQFN